MRDLSKFLSMLLVLLLFVSVSCKDDDPQPADDFNVISEYLQTNNLDLPDLLTSWITFPSDVNDNAVVTSFISSNYFIDIRAANDYNAGHIEGAVNGSLGTILTDAQAAAGKPIVVVCYTGQSAGHAVMALRLSGFTDAKVLKFGMSGWNSSFSTPWNNNIGSGAVGHSNWVSTAVTAPAQFSAPDITTTGITAEAKLQERVQFMLTKGFQGVSGNDVLTSPGNYFVNNFWAQTDTDTYGHIDGAYRLFPMSLADGDFDNLDPEKTIVTYCWTGQTSSMVTAFLTVMGYEAKSLKFGVNGLIYSQLAGHKFVQPTVDLPVVNE